MLSSLHMMIAAFFKEPGIALSQQEAEQLGAAIADVQQYYPDAVFDPKYMAWLGLTVCVMRIEVPRALLAASAVKQGKHKRKPKGPGNAPS